MFVAGVDDDQGVAAAVCALSRVSVLAGGPGTGKTTTIFLSILTYSSVNGGKKQIAKLVYDLDLPEAAKVTWTIGRLILWSNDVLLHLAGDGFAS